MEPSPHRGPAFWVRGAWLPLALGITGLSAAVFAWQSLLKFEQRGLAILGEAQARNAADTLHRGMQEYAKLLGGVAQRFGRSLGERRGWQFEIAGLEATLWAEPSGKVGWVNPLEGNQDLADADLSSSEAGRSALLRASASGQPSLTRSIALSQKDSRFYLVVPVAEEQGGVAGFFVGVFTARNFFPLVLRAETTRGWAVSVLENDRELYGGGSAPEGRWLAESNVPVLDAEWRIRVSPAPETLERLKSPLPGVVLAAGSAIALLFAASIGLAQSARRRARQEEAAEAALRESEEQYRLLFEGNPQPMWVYDDGTLRFLAVNEAAIRHYGYSRDQFLAMTLRDIRPAEEVPILEEYRAKRRREAERAAFHSPSVWKHRKKDGTLIDVEIAASPITFRDRQAWLTLAIDVTEKKQLEARFLQSQKMESAGRLAGGVAHDFNNLLGVIKGYGEIVSRQLPAEDPLRDKVEQILKAADRAASLTRQLLAFSRRQVLQPRILDLNTVVTEMERMLRRLIGEDIQLSTALDSSLGRVKADPGQMEQVLMNLVVNARDAMPRGGRLTIETANADLEPAYARMRPGLEPGPYVMLAVSDTGHGMDQSALSQIFEPFFTTKEAGRGTGLGLATVHGIVKQSGGHIFVYSEPGRGTSFKMYLPRLARPDTAAQVDVVEAQAPRGSETVLLVEDEASLRSLVRECLEANGYTVVEAQNCAEALEIGARRDLPLHLLVTDVVMPEMSGRELAERIAAARPEVKVLYMSGYTDDAVVRHGVLAEEMAFLQKPFTVDSLGRKVREVLDRPRK